jgi:hypothetical protein
MNSLVLVSLLSASLPAADEAGVKGFAVHEWGVFRIHGDVEVANADVRAEWDALPKFMYGNIGGRDLPANWGVTEIRRRPIVFFHTSKPMAVRMAIDFPGGLPGVWWPGTRSPATLRGKRPAVGTSLQWELFLKEPPPNRRPQHNGLREVEKGNWVQRIRAVKSDEVYAVFGDGGLDVDREKFVFYDGLFPQGKWLDIKVEKDRVALANRVKHAVHDVTVIDRRDAKKVRLGRVAKLDAGAEVKAIEWTEVAADRFATEAAAALEKQLIAAGLYKDEAASMIDVCKLDLFETAGLTVFYRLPQAEYEKRLPMKLTPRPESLVRVGLVLHSHCEPDFADRVKALVKQLDDDSFDKREEASKRLEAMGPSVCVHLLRLRKGSLSAEVNRRIDDLLDRWDAKKAFGR